MGNWGGGEIVLGLLKTWRLRGILLSLVALAGDLEEAQAQQAYESQEDTYLENFNSLPNTAGAFTWTDNGSLPGWYAANSTGTNFNPATAGTGSSTTGDLYSFGSANASDRALGSVGSGTVGNFYWGIRLINHTGATITGFTVSYTGEQWRNSGAAPQGLTFQYSLTATDIKTGVYTTVPELTFVGPVSGGSAGALDGNATANRTVVGPYTVTNINWPAGTELWLRFSDPDHTGNDHGLAVDDFSFKAAGTSGTYDPPPGYYNTAAGLSGEALQTALRGIISGHTVIPYTSSTVPDTWAALKVLDEDPGDSTKIKLTYSGVSVLKSDPGWNREHLWPQSRGIGDSGADYSDLFNLRPAYASVNSARSNKFFDESDPGDPGYQSPAASLAAVNTSSDSNSWEPMDNEKGDIARALFYMDIRYDGNLSIDPNTSDLVLENQIDVISDMAVLQTLLAWHDMDPPSEEERRRNHQIYTLYQGNRNPFVDHPEYAEFIFGDAVTLAEDADLDGIPTYWETVYNLNPENSLDANEDPDEDGFSNFEEYWMGSDPTDAASPPKLIVDASYTGSVENGTATYPYKKIQSAVDVVPANELRAILVKPGTYNERPYITGKNNIHLFSEQGASVTFIDGQSINSSVVRLYNFQKASFIGFTVANAVTTWYGAGLRVDAPNGTVLIAGNVVKNNLTSNTTTGAGGMYLKTASGSQVINNFIYGNQAVRGGGVLFAAGDARFWHNTVVGNTATGGNGGGLSALTGVSPDVRNNIVWGNTGTGGSAQTHQIASPTFNLIEGAANGSGNLGDDPLFVDAPQNDYHLTESSPAKNAGTPLPVAFDFDWDNRPDHTSSDMGADEIPSAGGDSDNNGLLDSWELEHFGAIGQSPTADPDGDGLTNLEEYQSASDPNDYFSQGGETIIPGLQVVSGNNQSGPPNEFLPEALTVKVVHLLTGAPLANAPVTFTVTSGGGLLALTNVGAPQTHSTLDLRTNAFGQAQLYAKHPVASGDWSVQATSGAAIPVGFNLTSQAPDGDSDTDGLLDEWELLHFGNLDQGAGDDPDEDGSPNWLEHLTGGDPLDLIDGLRTHLLAHWSLSEGSGSLLHDSSAASENDPLTNLGFVEGASWTKSFDGAWALSFDGEEDLVEIVSYGDSLDFGQDRSFAISVWLRTEAAASSQRIFSLGNRNASNGYFVGIGQLGAGRISFGVGSGGNLAQSMLIATEDDSFNDGEWHHVVASFDREGNQARIYVDGVARALVQAAGTGGSVEDEVYDFSANSASLNTSTYAPATIGVCAADWPLQEFFEGELDDIRIYGRSLGAAEAAALFANDLDDDGLADTWEALLIDSGLEAPKTIWNVQSGDDPDQDGWSNLEEFRNGTDPLVSHMAVIPFSEDFESHPPQVNLHDRNGWVLSGDGAAIVSDALAAEGEQSARITVSGPGPVTLAHTFDLSGLSRFWIDCQIRPEALSTGNPLPSPASTDAAAFCFTADNRLHVFNGLTGQWAAFDPVALEIPFSSLTDFQRITVRLDRETQTFDLYWNEVLVAGGFGFAYPLGNVLRLSYSVQAGEAHVDTFILDRFNPFSSEPPAQAPEGLSATEQQNGDVILSWNDQSDNEEGFLLEVSQDGGVTWNTVALTPANSATHTVQATSPGALANALFRVSARNQAGDNPGAGENAVPVPEPDEDWDQDGLTNEEEIRAGTRYRIPSSGGNLNDADTDEDNVIDSEDVCPREERISGPRLAEARYAVVDLGVLETGKTITDLSAHGHVLRSDGHVWNPSTGQWQQKVTSMGTDFQAVAVNNNGDVAGNAAYEPPQPTSYSEDWTAFFNNTRLAGYTEYLPEQLRSYDSLARDLDNSGRVIGSVDELKEMWWGSTRLPLGQPAMYSGGGWSKLAAPADEQFRGNYHFILYNGGEIRAVNAEGSLLGFWDYTRWDPQNPQLAYYEDRRAWFLKKADAIAYLPEEWEPVALAGEDWVLGRDDEGWGILYQDESIDLTRLLDHLPTAPVFVVEPNSRINSRLEILKGGMLYRNFLPVNLADLVPDVWTSIQASNINDLGLIAGSAIRDGDRRAVVLLPFDMAVDANRDGVIKFAGNPSASGAYDKTEEDKPFRFWLNNDHDTDAGDVVPPADPDNNDQVILERRDLEDMARLHLHFGGLHEAIAGGQILVGFKWKNTTGTPSINIFEHIESDGGTQYLTNSTVATQQAPATILRTTVMTKDNQYRRITAGTPYIVHPSFWSNLSEQNPNRYLLFEGCTEGKGQLAITLHKPDGTEIGEGPGVWLELMDIKKMYVRSDGNQFVDAPWDETDDTVIFVHGWRMSPAGRSQFAETFYKRLWHRGFKGRFAAFQWNTHHSNSWQWVPFIGGGIDAYLSKYNDSEQIAWESAEALKTFVNGLPGESKHVAAHSMGNIVTSEAIRLGMNVNNYALMQAAVPSAAYDEHERTKHTTTYNHFIFTMWDKETPDDDSDPATRALAYCGRFKDIGSSTNLVSFFLPLDYATFMPWEVNNDQGKPEGGSLAGKYRYIRNNPSGEKLYKYRDEVVVDGEDVHTYQVVDYYLTDKPYEALAHASSTWGKALGAQNVAQGAIDPSRSVALNTPAFQLSDQPPSQGFFDQHSGQFNARIQELKSFYDRLLDEFVVPRNP